jgi:hypothetical protein
VLSALDSITTGIANTAHGYDALTAVTEGSDNTGIGAYAATAITTGARNTVGRSANTGATTNDTIVIGLVMLFFFQRWVQVIQGSYGLIMVHMYNVYP